MKTSIATGIVAFALATPTLAFAQFGNMLGNVSGALGGKPANSGATGADVGAQQTQLVRTYVAAGKDVLTANGRMAEALGIKAQAVNDTATSDAFSASQLEAQDKAISTDAASVSAALKSGATLKDSQAKAKYAQGLLALASGVRRYMGMGKDVQSFSSGLSSVSPLQLGSLQSGVYIVRNLPGNLSNLTDVLKSAVDFARTNGVEVPADATSLL